MRELEPLELGLDRVDDVLIAVPETGHRSAAGSVEVMFAGAVDDINAVALDRERHLVLQLRGKTLLIWLPCGCRIDSTPSSPRAGI